MTTFGRVETWLSESAGSVDIRELSATGRCLVVLDDGEVEADLVRDVTGVLASFWAGRYGRRSAGDRAVKALTCAAGESAG